jgi:hypothetical protein
VTAIVGAAAAGRRDDALAVEWRQFTLLSRDSLRQLLNSAVLARDIDPVQFGIWTTALAATLPALYGFGQMFKYASLRRASAAVVERVVLGDRMFFVVYSMLAAALLAALTWEALFPDRTDQEVLGSLPVKPRTVAAARVSAAMFMAMVFSAAINVPSGLFFAFTSATHPLLGFLPTVFAMHIVSTVGAAMLVFLLLLLLRALVAVVAGAHVADRLASLLQFVSVVALGEVFFYLPTVLPFLVNRMLLGGAAAQWLPPAWMTALYTWGVGSPRPMLAGEAALGVSALLLAFVAVIPAYLAPARLMARRALESQASIGGRRRMLHPQRLVGVLARTPVIRSIAAFAVMSLARSRRHLLIVVSYAALGIAIGSISILAARIRGGLTLSEPSASLLALPLVLLFFLTFGVRAAFAVPTELDANWPYRLAPPNAWQAAEGTRVALLLTVLLPLVGITAAISWGFGWPASTVISAAVFTTVAGLLLLEFAVYGWTLVPCASAHAPAEDTLKSRWLLYLIPLNIFAFRGASLEWYALQSPLVAVVCVTVGVTSLIAIRTARARRARRQLVSFDIPPDQRIEVLNLSEALH